MFLQPLRQTAHHFSVLRSTDISWGDFSSPIRRLCVTVGSSSSGVRAPVFWCPAEGDFCALGKCMMPVQEEMSGGCRRRWGEPGHTAGSSGVSGSVFSLRCGVCWRICFSPGSGLAFVWKDRMFLVHLEVRFQGRALSFIKLCTSLRRQQLEPFWIYMLDAAALM